LTKLWSGDRGDLSLLATLLALLIPLSLPKSASSQPRFIPNPNRIISFQVNAEQGNVSFFASRLGIISAPKIQYLPSTGGQFVLVADFPDLYYPFPSKSVNVVPIDMPFRKPTEGRIELINFGQFQTMPAIFRIAIRASKLDVLRQISFKASPGLLAVSWSPSYPITENDSASATTAPKLRPSQCQANLKLSFSSLELNDKQTDELGLADQSDQVGKLKEADSLKKTSNPPYFMMIPEESSCVSGSANAMESSLKNEDPDFLREVPKIEVESTPNASNNGTDMGVGQSPIVSALKVRITTRKKIIVSSFRLHDPERYVMDFENLPALNYAELPKPVLAAPFRSIRVGSPEGKPTISRLVFDLTAQNCSVHSELANSDRQLVLTFNTFDFGLTSSKVIPTGLTIVCDPGHGGSDPGAQREGIQEKDITLAIANCLKQMLETRGIKVVLTRSNDAFVSLEERVKLTNSISPNLFLSIHINSLPSDSDIQGIETYYQTRQSKSLADAIHDNLVNSLGVPDRFVRKARFYVINHSAVPAVLAEVGFISSKDERQRLISFDYQNRIAKALEQGVILYLAKQNEVAHAATAQTESVGVEGATSMP